MDEYSQRKYNIKTGDDLNLIKQTPYVFEKLIKSMREESATSFRESDQHAETYRMCLESILKMEKMKKLTKGRCVHTL